MKNVTYIGEIYPFKYIVKHISLISTVHLDYELNCLVYRQFVRM